METVVSKDEGGAVPRLTYIDSLRGIASLGIAVFFHYVHFSSVYQAGSAPPTSAPFYSVLWPLYTHGYLAVDMFFMLSGFIFCHVYAESIKMHRVTARSFFVHRFSRLYPLHFATLCVTAMLVYAFRYQMGRFPVYEFNGLWDFILNVCFLQNGVLDRGFSFDGPSWSLSIEAILYLLFFAWAYRRGRVRWIIAAICFAIAMLLSGRTRLVYPLLMSPTVAIGAVGFFLGILIYKLGRTRPLVVIATLSLLGLTYALAKDKGIFSGACKLWIVFGIVLLALHRWKVLQKPLRWAPLVLLGDLSLAMYLLHFPLQVSIMLAINAMHRSIPFGSGLFLALYAALLILLSAVVYYRFELPMQRWLRLRLLSKTRSTSQAQQLKRMQCLGKGEIR